MEGSGSNDGFWDDGDWIRWNDLGDDEDDNSSHLAKLEREASHRWQFPNADLTLVPFFQELLALAEDYHHKTGKHLQVYGDIGELFGAITYGIKLHNSYAQGSDGRLGNEYVEIKTITPFNRHNKVTIRLDRHFSKLLVVRINEEFGVSGRLIDRKRLVPNKGKLLRLSWDALRALE